MPVGGADRPPGAGLDRDRLSKILARLSSPFDGEVAAAGRAAHRLIRAAGLSWEQVFEPAPIGGVAEDDPIGFCLDRAELLTDWERRFLGSIRRQPYPLTGKQCRVLRRIVGKCWGCAP
jgi:hypothetical protein